MGIFDKRENYKPFEYPEVMEFVNAMHKSFWVHSEVEFTADIQDFKSNLSTVEQEAVKRALLGIAQVEVSVKTFWGDLYDLFPKPEFNGLGATFAECEFRHSEAYARLLEVLGYNNEFENLLEVPIFKERNNILKEYLAKTRECYGAHPFLHPYYRECLFVQSVCYYFVIQHVSKVSLKM